MAVSASIVNATARFFGRLWDEFHAPELRASFVADAVALAMRRFAFLYLMQVAALFHFRAEAQRNKKILRFTSHQQLATSHQPPATSHQQPATSN